MKSFGLLFIAVTSLFLTSCTKDLDSRLVGTWDSSIDVSFFGISETTSGTMTFNENNSGTFTSTDGSEPFTWTASDDKVTLTFEEEDAWVFDVETNKKNEQVWSGVVTEMEDGLTLSITVTVNLTR